MARKPAKKRAARSSPGRPSALTAKSLEQIRKMAGLGLMEGEIAEILGIHPSTMWRWKESNPAVIKALLMGHEAANHRVELACYQLAVGYERTEEQVKFINGEEVRYKVRRHYPPDARAIALWTRVKMGWGEDTAPPVVVENVQDDRPVDVRVVARRVARLLHMANKETTQ